MNDFMLWATLVVLPVFFIYPIFAKIRRRGRTVRPDGLYTISEPEHPKDVTFE
jgi:hypothetical protein